MHTHRLLVPFLLVATGSAWADIPPPPPPSRDDAALPDTERVIVRSDPLGQSDDRTATRLERVLLSKDDPSEAQLSRLKACRADALAAGESPMRYLAGQVWFRLDGTVRKVKLSDSSGAPRVDDCVVAIASAVVLEPPPMFADHLTLSVTWAAPTVKPPTEEAP